MRQAVDSRMVAEIEEVVGGAGFDVPRRPRSWIRSGSGTCRRCRTSPKRSSTLGVEDLGIYVLSVFSSHMFHAAHQMGRLKY